MKKDWWKDYEGLSNVEFAEKLWEDFFVSLGSTQGLAKRMASQAVVGETKDSVVLDATFIKEFVLFLSHRRRKRG